MSMNGDGNGISLSHKSFSPNQNHMHVALDQIMRQKYDDLENGLLVC